MAATTATITAIFNICFGVQSSEYHPVYLQGRVNSFIISLEEMLQGLDDESFDNYKNGLIAKLLENGHSLQDETNRLWGQIVDKRYMFDMSEREAEELKGIEKNDIIEWYRTYLLKPSPQCRVLAIRLWGCNTDLERLTTESKSTQVIDDLQAFKKTSEFYPSYC